MRVGRVALTVSIAVVAWGPAVALGHGDVSTHAEHIAEDAAAHDRRRRAAADAAHASGHGRRTRGPPRRRSRGTSTRSAAGARSSTGRSSASTWHCCQTARCWRTTRWATPRPRPSRCTTITRATVWDPATGDADAGEREHGLQRLLQRSRSPDATAHCSSRAGTRTPRWTGIVQTHVFNYLTNTWSLGPNMAAGRWYPTVTPLRNGEMLITEGGPDMPEVRTTGGTLRSLSTASLNLPLYPVDRRGARWPRVLLRPRPDDAQRSTPTGTGAWQTSASATRSTASYGSHALYRRGQDPRRGRRRLERGRADHRHQRRDTAGQRHRADGQRAPPAQPHRAGRRHACSPPAATPPAQASSTSTTASTRPSCGTRPPGPGRRWPQSRRPGSTTRPRCCCPTAACCPRAAASAVPATRSATSPRTPRCSRRRTCSRPTAPASSRRARPIAGAPASVAYGGWLPDRHARRRRDPQGRARPPRRRHALGQHGAALRAADVHRRSRRADRDRARQRQHRPARRLHAVHRRRQRRAVGGEDGHVGRPPPDTRRRPRRR